VLRRLGKSNQYLAARWVCLDFDTRFDTDKPAPVLENFSRTVRSSGLGLSWEFDTRDNIFTPSKGFIAAVESLFYDPDWGSDEAFQTYRARIFSPTESPVRRG
jgi:outer membrane protein assembly factor BamA